jgi:adenine-specific DNA-methyltransferase
MLRATVRRDSPRSAPLNLASPISELPGAAKLRGGFYTPRPIAEFLSSWAVRTAKDSVLEPSAGDGVFVDAVSRQRVRPARVVAIENDACEARKITNRHPDAEVTNGDFFSWYLRANDPRSFDAVIGNPPFVRYQDFDENHRTHAFALMRREGLRPTRLTNAWVPFVVAATSALRNRGRLAMVLPAELMQVTYAAELREYLAKQYERLTVVTFRKLVFAGIQQETILLLGVRGESGGAKITFVEVGDGAALNGLTLDVDEKTVALDHAREKWTQYYLTASELGLVRDIERNPEFVPLSHYAEVDVGIVTGCNTFFVLTPSDADRLRVRAKCVPLVGRSAQVNGVVLRKQDWQTLERDDEKCLLLNLGDVPRDRLSAAARTYVADGERQKLDRGYKCSIRLPNWWSVPAPWIPDAFMLRQIHSGPRIIANASGATCTDTIHRVRASGNVNVRTLAAASINSLTCAFAEIRGRSYGGGVLELEPTEAEGLLFPKLNGASLPVGEIDTAIRRDGAALVQQEVDRQVLRPAGLSQRDIEALRSVWHKLSERRRSRRHSAA